MKSWMPTRLLTGEGRSDREETDKHMFGPPERALGHISAKEKCFILADWPADISAELIPYEGLVGEKKFRASRLLLRRNSKALP